MKTALKIMAALAAAAGAICVLAVYGEKIVAWCKKIVTITTNEVPAVKEETVVNEPAAEEPATEEAPAGDAPAEPEIEVEIVVENKEPVAEEADFEA